MLHKECKIIGIENRRQKQLLWLMYLVSKKEMYLKIPGRDTRRMDKVDFKVPTKISHVYGHSPYYIGTKLWDS